MLVLFCSIFCVSKNPKKIYLDRYMKKDTVLYSFGITNTRMNEKKTSNSTLMQDVSLNQIQNLKTMILVFILY